MDFYAFDKLFAKNVQSIFEKIFLSLDYESFKKCLVVSHSWEELLNSESFIKARKYLYQDEISNDQEKLAFAARQGDIAQVTRILINKMLDVNAGHPLLKAVIGGHKVVVRLLLERGADPNKPEIGEKTPLHWSAYYGHRAVTKLLINGGGDPNQGDRDGRTPLHDAISTSFIKGGMRHRDQKDVVHLLLKGGAEVNKQTRYGETPLHRATYYGCNEVAIALLERGARSNLKDDNGRTPLHWANRNRYDIPLVIVKMEAMHKNGHLDTVNILLNNA